VAQAVVSLFLFLVETVLFQELIGADGHGRSPPSVK
jgi:hypothetical protein